MKGAGDDHDDEQIAVVKEASCISIYIASASGLINGCGSELTQYLTKTKYPSSDRRYRVSRAVGSHFPRRKRREEAVIEAKRRSAK